VQFNFGYQGKGGLFSVKHPDHKGGQLNLLILMMRRHQDLPISDLNLGLDSLEMPADSGSHLASVFF